MVQGRLRERRRKRIMPRRLPEKTRNAPKKPRRFGSQRRYRSTEPLFRIAPVKENQEAEVMIDDIGSKADGVAKIQSFLIFVPRCKIGERARVKTLPVSEKFATAERIG